MLLFLAVVKATSCFIASNSLAFAKPVFPVYNSSRYLVTSSTLKSGRTTTRSWSNKSSVKTSLMLQVEAVASHGPVLALEGYVGQVGGALFTR